MFGCTVQSQCIDPALVCDCTEDCEDGSDEADSMCNKLRFRCEDMCHPLDQLCDGNQDCADASDEDEEFCTHGQSSLFVKTSNIVYTMYLSRKILDFR